MASGHSQLRAMLVDDSTERLAMMEQALQAEGHTVVARLDTHADLSAAVALYLPDIVFIDVDAPGRDTLESLGQLSREHPRPIVLFAARSDAETTRRAVHAGVSAYVVDGLHPTRLRSLLELAIARFELHQTLRRELDDARVRLADQRDIEKAKGVLMKRRKLDEASAYDLLRRMAMDRQQRIGEFARAADRRRHSLIMTASAPLPERSSLRLGMLPLADAAPFVVAKSCGFFARRRLHVELSVERAWSALRDKLAAGLLDGAQMLAPMPIAATLGLDGVAVPMVTALSLNLNGNAIIVSRKLFAQMQAAAPAAASAHDWARALASVLTQARDRSAQAPTLAHVFPFSTHHYELRLWLISAGIDPDRDVRLCVVPPPRMVDELAAGRIDGYCVGAPWNQVAVRRGLGVEVATKYAIWNNSPEKVLAVTRDWAALYPHTHRALIAALLEATRWLDARENRARAAQLMIEGGWVQAPPDVVRKVLDEGPEGLVFHRRAANFPWRSHAIWFAQQMQRWHQCPIRPDFNALAHEVYRCETYREAAALVGMPCPASDFKSEGTHAEPWTVPGDDGVPLELGPDLLIDGSHFDPASPIEAPAAAAGTAAATLGG